MNRARFLRCAMSAAAVLLFSGLAYGLVDDRNITINSTADVTSRRQALVNFIWGAGGFPSGTLPSSVAFNVPSPVAGLTNLERVDTLNISMEAGQSGVAHHFIPVRKNNRLVVVHHGPVERLLSRVRPRPLSRVVGRVRAVAGGGRGRRDVGFPVGRLRAGRDVARLRAGPERPTLGSLAAGGRRVAVGLDFGLDRGATPER